MSRRVCETWENYEWESVTGRHASLLTGASQAIQFPHRVGINL